MSKVWKEIKTELKQRLITNYRETMPTHKELMSYDHRLSFYDHKREIIINAVHIPEKEAPDFQDNASFKNIKIQKKNQKDQKFDFYVMEFRADFESIEYNDDEGHLILSDKNQKYSVFAISEKIEKIQEIDFAKLDLRQIVKYSSHLTAFIVSGNNQTTELLKF